MQGHGGPVKWFSKGCFLVKQVVKEPPEHHANPAQSPQVRN
jgi:hypothetical protein